MSKLHQAWQLAVEKHGSQMYGDRPYSAHLHEVYMAVVRSGGSETAQIVAILHDVLEDTDCRVAEVSSVFGLEVFQAVLMLTKIDGLSYDNYIWAIRNNPLALEVKIADTLCNLTQSHKEGNLQRIRKYSKQLYLLTKPKWED